MLTPLIDYLPDRNVLKGSQKIRVISEAWAARHIFCPACGGDLEPLRANLPVADLGCLRCSQQYELKSKAGYFGKKIVDGAYASMIQRLESDNAPNLLLLSYEKQSFKPQSLFAIPSQFFRPISIEKRKPLANTAKRAGWVGCNILLTEIPLAGRIVFIENQQKRSKDEVISKWRMATALTNIKPEAKGWLLDVMLCVDSLRKSEFTLDEVYLFEAELSSRHPENRFIRDKIRQQLQCLRDIGYLQFVARGRYKLASS
jgi:type II restriction enzyme